MKGDTALPDSAVLDAAGMRRLTVAREPFRPGYRDVVPAPAVVAPLRFPDVAVDVAAVLD